ncbi:LiaF transmembrane domain-containing protein [Streptomyces aureus]|uniref:LiaF transmembrane domain-containing protein n=1 Tax=Streptomyces aureus TaxID=193461 RepID=UPI0033F82611
MRSHLRIWIALMLLGAGLLVLTDRLAPSARVWERLSVWWPLGLVALGCGGAVRLALATRTALRGPFLITLAGLITLVVTTDPLPRSVRPLLWPVLLVGAGVAMLVRVAVGGPGARDDSVVPRLVSVAESRHVVWPVGTFSLGSLTAVASGCVIDLREAHPLEGRARIDVTAVLGGVEIRVPGDWDVRYERFGREVETSPPAPGLPLPAPRPDREPGTEDARERPFLHVTAMTFLAGVEVRPVQAAGPTGGLGSS